MTCSLLVSNSFHLLLAALPNLNFDRACAYYDFIRLFLKSYRVFMKELMTGLTCRRAQCIYFAIANHEPHLGPQLTIEHHGFIHFVRAFISISTVFSAWAWSNSSGAEACRKCALIILIWQGIEGYWEVKTIPPQHPHISDLWAI